MPNELPTGLALAEAAERLRRDGPNELGATQRRGLAGIVGEVVREPMFLLLLGAGGIYAVMGDMREAVVLLGFVVIIMAVTVLQERRTDRALDALRDLSSPRALALRGGKAVRIPGREVVKGDVLLLAEGDRIPADGVLLQVHELAADESLLTGESEPVPKRAAGERVFAGTLVVSGQGGMRVEATGSHTELGRIGASLQDIGLQASPLREEVARLTRRLLAVGLALCALLVALFWLLRGDALQALLAGITLAMGVLPQEFPVIMIVFLALAARRLAAQQVLTRRLNAIETLGQTTVLAVDKTGTLTLNRMAMAALSVNGQAFDVRGMRDAALPEIFHELLEYAVLASEIEPHDPMEQAFHRLAAAQLAGTEHLHPSWALAREYELAPELLAMSHLWRERGRSDDTVAAKGAPEAIAELCHLDAAALEAVRAEAAELADQGLRVLAVAKARHPAHRDWPAVQHDFDFTWLGLVALADPLRPEVPQAVATCHRAGIRVLMITGDHPRTAQAIAGQAGLDASRVITGEELEALSGKDLVRVAGEASVFARMRPRQKLALVEALKARGDVVAMTGDGVNDAPALKAAHIGIAMGQRGTDVAREAASLVLLHDDFASIVTAIHRGRRTFVNLRRALTYTVAVHVPIVGLALLPVMLGLPVVLAPMHIAFLELVIDPACSLVFEAEQGGDDLMGQPPRRRAESLLPLGSVLQSLLQGLLATALVMGLYAWLQTSAKLAQLAPAAAFTALVAANAALILPSRTGGRRWARLFTGLSGVSRLVVAATIAALFVATGVPAVALLFGFAALPPALWLGCVAAGFSMAVPFELARRWLGPERHGVLALAQRG
ncbi:cation-translocating P-type ATPase [Azohydromonas lata]|uniref:Cation-translocating P-type ATPase n=1 Tax=Azohydromonas lata TaxID=45677 RepID=A0ABU5ID91_9BURK|nr:cation-translocating P-type ATPase [Azohydromonas lata]MDZ5456789.1 cation-translocating P-type ATPase [Azohydromonas lata]